MKQANFGTLDCREKKTGHYDMIEGLFKKKQGYAF